MNAEEKAAWDKTLQGQTVALQEAMADLFLGRRRSAPHPAALRLARTEVRTMSDPYDAHANNVAFVKDHPFLGIALTEAEHRYREVILPEIVERVTAEINAMLPDGLELRFEEATPVIVRVPRMSRYPFSLFTTPNIHLGEN